MLITGKKRIRKASKYMSHIAEGEKAYIGLAITEDVSTRLKEIGFDTLYPGESLVPSPKLGTVSRFNANGKSVPEKDKPKETAYRQQYWEWEDWGGNHHSRTVDIPYQRYPRKWIPSPWIELIIVQSGEEKLLLAGPAIVIGKTEETNIVHQINLMLEIFKRVEIFQENLERYEVPKVIKLGWNVLPAGNMPWERFKSHLTPVIDKLSKGKKIIIKERLETVSQYKPDFHAIGENGYRGYIIFGFTKQNIYIFESAEYGNATYVFQGNWEQLSKMTKAEIVNGNHHKHRFVHLEGWKSQIQGLFPDQNDKKIS
ncbi:hypothetical protein [Guptibacillus hwajinpoensis]|uniref:hypothetical protein n=1 Tax=Guptibacillus hwajinpoensis TaxID=208199 RepID=UPI001CFE76A3|nr:hypothetical protein [Pseudalkalibacillus hwajinpoensis]WLR60629.1 hypothetical protein LC071_04540 [Pseudalkalibacillus hwajinpoensis]